MTRVKTCGITCAADAALCVEAGADALGLVVEYPLPVPWTLSRSQARSLAARFRAEAECVAVVGGDASTILAIVAAVEPGAVQLHADEPVETVAAVKEGLAGTGIAVVKAVRIAAGDASPAAHWLRVAQTFVDAGADRILVDSKTPARPAGTGVAVDWAVAAQLARSLAVPVVLAGGLTPDNVAEAVREVAPWAVDVISSIEDDSHRKVPDRVRAFVAAAKRRA